MQWPQKPNKKSKKKLADFFILDIFKNVHFQKPGSRIFWKIVFFSFVTIMLRKPVGGQNCCYQPEK